MAQDHKLTAIMFSDIVGFSIIMGNDESSALDLLHQNKQLQQPIVEKYNGQWLKEMGDGVMSCFNTPTDAVYAALEIQKGAKTIPGLSLRLGIHLGEIIFENGDIYGDGVNIASRLQAIAEPDEILVSESVKQNIHNKKGLSVKNLGKKNLKNIKDTVRVFRVSNTNKLDKKLPDTIRLNLDRKITAYLLLSALTLIIAYFAYMKFAFGDYDSNYVSEASIVVLPFENLSPDPDQGFFTDGVTEELLGSLSRISDLKVISRTSSMKYKGTQMTIPEIATELNVDYVIEGSVRKSDNRVRIFAQLIHAKTDNQIWSDTYDRELNDIFAVQSSVSEAIAGELKISISPEVNRELSRIPTLNMEAYQLYLRGKQLITDRSEESLYQGKELFKSAIELDSLFAEALAEYGNATYLLYGWDYVHDSLNYPEKAFAISQKALSLKPNMERPYSVMGAVAAEYKSQWKEGMDYYIKALRINPSDPTTLHRIVWILTNSRYTNEAVIIGKKSVESDPFSAISNLRYIKALISDQQLILARKEMNKFKLLFPDLGRMIFDLENDYYFYSLDCEELILNNQYYEAAQCFCLAADSINMRISLDSTNFPNLLRSIVEWRFQKKYDSVLFGLDQFLDVNNTWWSVNDPFFKDIDTIPEYRQVYNRTPGGKITVAQVKEIMKLIE